MVLVDTSVWIRALAGHAPYKKELGALLQRNEVAGHQFVHGELLMGDPGGRLKVLTAYEGIPQAALIPHAEVVALVRSRRLHGQGVGCLQKEQTRRNLSSAGPRRSKLTLYW